MTTTSSAPPAAASSTRDPSPFPDDPAAGIRPLRPGDGLAVRRLFRAGLPVGRRLALQYADLVNYERQCLDWYLTRGRSVGRVVEVDGEVVGYALPCLDHRALDLWLGQRAVLWTGRATYRFGVGRLGRDGRHFARLRVQDVTDERRDPRRRPFPSSALVHTGSLTPDRRRAVLETVDELVASAGGSGWSFAVEVRDAAAVAELGADGTVTRVAVARTTSWLADAPVWRVTVARTVGAPR